jgi:hypothetical protein
LYFDRPGETDLGTEGKETLDTHLRDCGRCRRQAQAERRADEHVGAALRQVPVPNDLSARLKLRLAAERRSTYRRFVLRLGRDLAVAAALLLAIFLGGRYWSYYNRPVLDLEEMVNSQLDWQPEQIERLATATLRTSIVLPRNFNYGRLYSYSVQELKGRLVPRLLFRSPDGRIAEVLILTDAQFNLGRSLDKPRFGSGNLTMELRLDQQDPRIGYLFIYSGESVDDWLIIGDAQIAT